MMVAATYTVLTVSECKNPGLSFGTPVWSTWQGHVLFVPSSSFQILRCVHAKSCLVIHKDG